MKCQVEKLECFRHTLLFEFNRGTKAAEAARNICAVYGDNAVGESMAIKRFSRFKKDRFNISDIPRAGRLSGFHEDCWNTLIHNDPRQYTWEQANVMNCDHSTIVRHKYSMGKVQKSGVRVPHALSQNHKNQRVGICASLLWIVIDWLVNNIDHSHPVSLLVTRNGVYMLTQGKEKNDWARTRAIFRKCSNFSICTPFSSIHGSTHYLQMTKLQYVNSSTTLELRIKNDNR